MKPLHTLATATLLALSALSLLPGCNGASNIARDSIGREGEHGFMVKTLQRGFWTRKYGLFIPRSYHRGTTQKYPVIIFLHGVGEGSGFGEGDLKNMTVGIGPAVARKADSLGFIVIFPQSDGHWSPESDYTMDMFTALANTCREYPVDQDCITLTGLSTGGAGTWAIGAKYNDQFSALVPMGSNGSNPEEAHRLTNLPVRAYCSVFGDIFAGWNDQGMVNRIKTLNPSANAQFIATPTFGHDCWENVYGGDEIYDWMKHQRRTGTHAALPSSPDAPVPVALTPRQPPPSALITPPEPAAHPAPVMTPTPAPTRVIYTPPARPAPSVIITPLPQPSLVPSQKPASRTDAPAWLNTPW